MMEKLGVFEPSEAERDKGINYNNCNNNNNNNNDDNNNNNNINNNNKQISVAP